MGRFGSARRRLVGREVSRVANRASDSYFESWPGTGLVQFKVSIDYRQLGMKERIARAKDQRPVMKAIIRELTTNADAYARSDRFRGHWAVESGGFRINWHPGYPGYKGWDKLKALRQEAAIWSHRPYMPVPTPQTSAMFARWGAEYIVTGESPL